MTMEHRAARKSGPRTNLYDDITDKIIAELEDGRLPWVQPWGTAAAQAPLAMPRNAATSRQYSGINVLILWGAVIQQGYPTQHWLTAAPPSSTPTVSRLKTRSAAPGRPGKTPIASRS